MTDLLTEYFEGSVSITGPFETQHKKAGVTCIPGRRHETLCDAESFFSYRNMRLQNFEKIFSVMRNPYDLELSRYAYLRKNLPQDNGKAQEIALNNDYRGYLRKAPFFGMNPPRLDLYYHHNGIMPDNLVVLRFERLVEDIKCFLSPYLGEGYKLPHVNSSAHDEYAKIYDEELEKLCFERNRWFFEKGFYPRISW
ncbi:MAG: hypothetical protein HOC70_01265 [Gammaproteobacteria bacterium]|nr:hypothetical protein [Gammaproteobacteria bacterium]MBT7371284.1 hypothetical protein [Gammaproteobacteria bacterium]